ncbi:MAG: dihydroorotase, partial [Thiothrix sp.]
MDAHLIVNATIVNEGLLQTADVLIRAGRIDAIGQQLAAPANIPVFDASGLHLFPGMIDDQVHFREPGMTHKGD